MKRLELNLTVEWIFYNKSFIFAHSLLNMDEIQKLYMLTLDIKKNFKYFIQDFKFK